MPKTWGLSFQINTEKAPDGTSSRRSHVGRAGQHLLLDRSQRHRRRLPVAGPALCRQEVATALLCVRDGVLRGRVTRGHRWRRHGPIAGPLARRVSARTTALSAKIRLVGTQGSFRRSIAVAGRAFAWACAKRLRLVSANDLAVRRRSRCGPLVRLRRPKAKLFPTGLDQRQQGPREYTCAQHPTRPATPCVRCGRWRSITMASDPRSSG